mmetsp:Transcript_35062/g.59075  ORF Transcript_35062/g.59075 Transcript_35062/m.59075 type:complete len:326 (+) Transcript_35062:247-1224(+)
MVYFSGAATSSTASSPVSSSSTCVPACRKSPRTKEEIKQLNYRPTRFKSLMKDSKGNMHVMNQCGAFKPVDSQWIKIHIKSESESGAWLLNEIDVNRGKWILIPAGRASTRSSASKGEAEGTGSSASDDTCISLQASSVPGETVPEAPPGEVFFRQMGDNCMAAAAANALHLTGQHEHAQTMFDYGESLAWNDGDKAKKPFSTLHLKLRQLTSESGTVFGQGERTFEGYEAARDSHRENLLPFLISPACEITDPVMVLLVDVLGHATHVVVFFNGLVYDSNKNRPIKICSVNTLNQCVPNGKTCIGAAGAVQIKIIPKKSKKSKK